ncbi:MAG: hypothetical protein ACLU22_06455 [Clostridium sp.]
MNINKKLAKSISYGGVRDLKSIKYIVLHFTGNKGDTAKNNALFYATGNTREAGAHSFVDTKGEAWQFQYRWSVVAWDWLVISTLLKKELLFITRSAQMQTAYLLRCAIV